MIFYLLLCVISILTGQGLLHLIGGHIERRISLYLAPVITLTLWAIVLGIGVSVGFPVKYLVVVTWAVTIVLIAIAIVRQDYSFIRSEWPLLLIVIFLPVCIMVVYFWYGLWRFPGSTLPDGWSYIAYGQYLWEYPRGAEGGLAPLYQYAAHLNRTRFIASAFLGVFSPLIGTSGDTQASSGYFLAWTLFVFSSTCLCFAVIKGFRTALLLLYASMSTFSSWVLSALWANNYDNALALSFLPAFAAVLSIADAGNRRWAPVLALLTAGILYCYPEMAIVVLGGAFLFLLQHLSLSIASIKKLAIMILIVSGIVAFLVVPFVNDMIWFVRNQASALTWQSGSRPGEGFASELLTPHYQLMAFWGFGGERFSGSRLTSGAWYYIQGLLAVFLSILLGLGLMELFRKKEWGLSTTIVLLLICSIAMIILFSYAYGAYKFILLNWWGISFAVVTGFAFVMNIWRMRKYRLIAWISLSAVLFAIFFFINGFNAISLAGVFQEKDIQPFREVENIKSIVGKSPLLVSVDNDLSNRWAVYFLRNCPIYLAEYRSYMAQPHVIPYMLRSQKVDLSRVQYILTDGKSLNSLPSATLVWSKGVYNLWMVPNERWIFISSMRSLKGIDDTDGEHIFWLGQEETEMRLVSAEDGQAVISADFMRGPGWPEHQGRTILVSTDQRDSSIVVVADDGPRTLSVPIVAGRNRIILRPQPMVRAGFLPDAEQAPLLFGLRSLKVRLESDAR